MTFLLGLNVGVLSLLALLVIRKQPRTRADRWLAAYLGAAVTMFACGHLAITVAQTPLIARLYGTGLGYMVLSVLFFAYVNAVCGRSNRWIVLWFLPFAISMAWSLWLERRGPADLESGFMVFVARAEWERWIKTLLMLIHTAFPIAGLAVVHRFGDRAHAVSSDPHSVTLTWLRWLLASSLALTLFAVLLFLPGREINVLPLTVAGPVLLLLVSIQQFLMGYFGLYQTRVFLPLEQPVNSLSSTRIDEQAAADLGILKQMITASRPHLKSRLTLDELAESTGWAPGRISAAINQGGENFFEFINRFRVEEVKTRIRQQRYRRASLLHIAHDCGFNSKSSFNAVFRRLTGVTPSEYRREASG
jgi:AraC-like DNA-binding protein